MATGYISAVFRTNGCRKSSREEELAGNPCRHYYDPFGTRCSWGSQYGECFHKWESLAIRLAKGIDEDEDDDDGSLGDIASKWHLEMVKLQFE